MKRPRQNWSVLETYGDKSRFHLTDVYPVGVSTSATYEDIKFPSYKF